MKDTLYVDNFTIYMTAAHKPTDERILHATVSRIQEWTHTHGFKVSSAKTVAVQFHNKQQEQMNTELFLRNNRFSLLKMPNSWDSNLTINTHEKSISMKQEQNACK